MLSGVARAIGTTGSQAMGTSRSQPKTIAIATILSQPKPS